MTIKLPEPFLGRLVLEAVEQDVSDYLADKSKLDKDSHLRKSGFEIVAASVDAERGGYKVDKDLKVPLKKGKIIKAAPDAFGESFQKKYGAEVGKLGVGDLVWFIPMQTYKLEPSGKYHIIGDEDVIAYERG